MVILLGRCELDEEVVLIFSSSLLSVLDDGEGSRDERERSNEGGRRENFLTDMLLLPHASLKVIGHLRMEPVEKWLLCSFKQNQSYQNPDMNQMVFV